MATAFLANDDPDNNTDVGHRDADPHNNHPSNLAWQTHKENCNDAGRNEKISLARSKPVVCVETGATYPSIKKASKELNLLGNDISACCKAPQKSLNGFHYEYLTE